MKKNRKLTIIVAAVIILCSGTANAQGVKTPYEKCQTSLIISKDVLQIKKSGAKVGYIQGNKIFTHFPHAINKNSYSDIEKIIKFLNKNTPLKNGEWYLNITNGECGFYLTIPAGIGLTEAFEKYWNSANLYALYPELHNFNYQKEYPVEYAEYALMEYPLSVRTAADLELIDKMTHSLWKDQERSLYDAPPKDIDIRKISFPEFDFTEEDIDIDADYLFLKGKQAMYYSFDLPIIYFTLAAAKGDWHSQHKLAWLLEEKTDQDEKRIFTLYKTAAEKGACKCCPAGLAEIDLARCYWYGIGTEVNRKKSFELASEFLKKFPENKDAMLLTGLWYFYETAEKKQGISLIEKAQKGGFMSAVLERCVIEEFGLGGRPQEIRYASNFSHVYSSPAQTVHSWLAGYWLNARNYERWVKLGGYYYYWAF